MATGKPEMLINDVYISLICLVVEKRHSLLLWVLFFVTKVAVWHILIFELWKTFKNIGMELLRKFGIGIFVLMLLIITTNLSCDNDGTKTSLDELENINLSTEDTNALLFMLEEEKLARDTYDYLDILYTVNQFSNIKLSEQSHMNAVMKLLDHYGIAYTILPYGVFENKEIQDLYNQFVEKGQIDVLNALDVGATIEDLDIVDLEEFIEATSNSSIISVFESLQCGSRNHLRSFVSAIENSNEVYEPQFLTLHDYNEIIGESKEKCGR
jgi:hypothetical protein